MTISKRIDNALPENVIVEILSWLPVKDLLQFKSVCKSWYAIISSPHFICKHMNNYYKNSDNSRLLALYDPFAIDTDDLQLFELPVDGNPEVKVHEPCYSPLCGSYIYGPCDGIYYLQHEYGERAFWNLATDELRVLPDIIAKPDLPSDLSFAAHEVCGFGFDLATQDYKLVVIKGYWNRLEDDVQFWPSPLSVLIYSLKANSWRYWGDLPEEYELERNRCYMFLHGCCYWLGSRPEYENSELILSFDMANETFEEIDVPDYDQADSRSLGIYHESIALLSVHKDMKLFEIWTWNEGQWTKKITMGLNKEIRRPIGHCQKSKIVLESDDGELVLCDPNKQEIRDLKFQSHNWCVGVFDYKESLISMKDMECIGVQ